jgi:hypothetical protein
VTVGSCANPEAQALRNNANKKRASFTRFLVDTNSSSCSELVFSNPSHALRVSQRFFKRVSGFLRLKEKDRPADRWPLTLP